MARAGKKHRQPEGASVKFPWALTLPRIDPEVGNQMKRSARSGEDPGAELEARVREAQKPWSAMRGVRDKLRGEEGAGFILWGIALSEEQFWLSLLQKMRQARTNAELSIRNYAYGCLWVWRLTARAGTAVVVGEWILDQVAAATRSRPLVALPDWSPDSPTFSVRLLDALTHAQTEASVASQGFVMTDRPNSPQGLQANYLLAGLLKMGLSPDAGERRRGALAQLSGEDSLTARRAQLLRELPGATRIAWSEQEPGESLADLRNRVSGIIESIAADEVFFAGERRIDPSLDRALKNPKKNREYPNKQAEGIEVSPEANPEALLETQEAVRWEMEHRIKEHGLNKREAEVARLRFEGKDTSGIAAALGISAVTVRVHDKNIRDKVPRDKAS